jgi:DNA repair protein REV1
LESFNFDAKELRGIGIQIQKLEGENGMPSDTDTGQGKLPFRPAEIPDKDLVAVGPKIVIHPASSPPEEDNGGADTKIIVETPALPTKPIIELPSFSQVDKDVFDTLPEDVRRELEAEYKRRSASPVPTSIPSPAKIPPRAKITVKGINVKRITQQLAPRNRPVMTSPKKNALFAKNGGPSTVNISDAELRKLDIDPEVFAILPVDIQREQLAMARSAKNAGGQANFIRARKVIKPFNRISRSPSAIRRRPLPRAHHIQPPFLKQQGKQKGEKLYFTEKDDVQNVIESWVEGFKLFPPNAKDVEYFSKFLVNCVDAEKSTDSGIEKAIGVVKWWLILLRRHWAGWEFAGDIGEDDINDMSKEEKVGRAWWKAFREVKEKMDIVARKRFGGSLSLK